MGGTTVLIDIDSIGIRVNDIALEFGKTVKKPSRSSGGSAVGTVHQDPHAGEIGLYSGNQMVDIVVASLLVQICYLSNFRFFAEGWLFIKEDHVFDLILQCVGKLKTLAVKNFDPVVFKGVMRSGNDNTGVCFVGYGQKSHSRSWDHSKVKNVRPRRT